MDYVKKFILVGLFILVLASALGLPFVYESQTLWYKIGVDKTMLRAGQLSGMIALTLLFTQVLLAVGGPFLQKAFGLKNLMSWHRLGGVLIVFFALIHVFLILVPEGLANLPIGKKFWPEMVGSLLLWVLVAMVISSRYREKLKLNYKRWRVIHKPLGYLATFLVVIHVLYVSDSFEQALPRNILFVIFTMVLVRVGWVKVSARITQKR